MDDDLSYRKHLGAGWLTLNRPSDLNSLTADLLHAISARLEEAAADPTLAAVVFTGAGRAFCAGADLKVLDALPQAERDQTDRGSSSRRRPPRLPPSRISQNR
jgi:enoyl-CoA hydratase/carnithine racemase